MVDGCIQYVWASGEVQWSIALGVSQSLLFSIVLSLSLFSTTGDTTLDFKLPLFLPIFLFLAPFTLLFFVSFETLDFSLTFGCALGGGFFLLLLAALSFLDEGAESSLCLGSGLASGDINLPESLTCWSCSIVLRWSPKRHAISSLVMAFPFLASRFASCFSDVCRIYKWKCKIYSTSSYFSAVLIYIKQEMLTILEEFHFDTYYLYCVYLATLKWAL